MSAGQSQQFCVRWNSHLGSLGAAFPQLLAGQRFVDVTLACEGHQVHCHRLVLAACSTYFENLLGENPCQHPIIILPRDIKLWAIQALVDFMYKGEVNVSQAGLPDLMKCAEILKIRGLCGSDALNLNQIHSPTGSFHQQQQQQQQQQSSTDSDAGDKIAASTKPSDGPSAKQTSGPFQPPQYDPNCPRSQPSSSYTGPKGHLLSSLRLQPVVMRGHHQQHQHQDEGNTSDNGGDSGNEICIKTEDLMIDEDTNSKQCEDDDERDDDNDGSDKLPAEFALANVTCEYEMNSQQPAQDSGTVSRRVRRSEELLQQAAEYVSRGETFQNVSVRFDIPISTIRFYMARKGILPRRKRGRSAMLPYSVSHRVPMDTVMAVTGVQSGPVSQQQYQQQLNENMAMASLGTSTSDANQPTMLPRNAGSRSPSPSGPPFHFANYKLPELRPNLM